MRKQLPYQFLLKSTSTKVPTVTEAARAFIDHKVALGAWSPISVHWWRRELERFVELGPDELMSSVDGVWLAKYVHSMAYMALASQRSRWHSIVEWLTWCVRKRWLAAHPRDEIDTDALPWAGRKGAKAIGRGKTQLRNADEVRAYLRAALRHKDRASRVAACLPVMTGMRSGEIRHLRCGDIDLTLGRIWIRGAEDRPSDGWDVKTASSRRTVALPDDLVGDIEAMIVRRSPDDWLFEHPDGGVQNSTWLWKLVNTTCKKAKVREVSAHGLRDTYASLQVELARASAADVATLLGHNDRGATARKHYIGVAEHRPALAVLQGGASRLKTAAPTAVGHGAEKTSS